MHDNDFAHWDLKPKNLRQRLELSRHPAMGRSGFPERKELRKFFGWQAGDAQHI